MTLLRGSLIVRLKGGSSRKNSSTMTSKSALEALALMFSEFNFGRLYLRQLFHIS